MAKKYTKKQIKKINDLISLLEKAKKRETLNLAEIAMLLNAHEESQVKEIYDIAGQLKDEIYGNRVVIFAPLYISPNNLPKNFIIFRVDNPGLTRINKSNVESEIFQKFKTVKLFDLTKLHKESVNKV